jgi:transposase-like protein
MIAKNTNAVLVFRSEITKQSAVFGEQKNHIFDGITHGVLSL